ncbi:MAG: DUF2934 domain-containing protein [Proteobacteria bacterium]|nr:DUF2934 domain-containing protein [Pseudomonadota bacterium]
MGKLQDREIAELAYELYEKSGWAQGKDEEHWLEAERVMEARSSAKKAARAAAKTTGKTAKSTKTAAAKSKKKTVKKSAKKSTEKEGAKVTL